MIYIVALKSWRMMVLPITVGNMQIRAEKGFTYLAVLLLVFILLLSLGAASEHIATINKREREAELIFVGEQYRNAIASYYQNSPGGVKQLPLKLESLILDKRSINRVRHLRKLYQDPITDSNEWGLVNNPQGEITGVYSLSNESVLTTVNNPSLLQNIQVGENSANHSLAAYSDWRFIFKPDNQDRSLIGNGSDAPSEVGVLSDKHTVVD